MLSMHVYPNRKHLLRDVVQRDIVLGGNFIFALKLRNHNCHLLDILFDSVWLNLALSSRSQFVIVACEKIFRNYVEDMFWWPLVITHVLLPRLKEKFLNLLEWHICSWRGVDYIVEVLRWVAIYAHHTMSFLFILSMINKCQTC